MNVAPDPDTLLRLDPDLPVCWEDLDTLRIGFDRAEARLRQPSAAAQRLLGSLMRGFPSDRLDHEAKRAGTTQTETRELLADLGTVLRADRVTGMSGAAVAGVRERRLATRVHDDGRDVPGLRQALSLSGLCEVEGDGRASQVPDLVVHVERFLEPLERAHRWLSEAIPHLLVRFTDRAVRVGPIVQPPGSPCHTCCSLAVLAEDAAYPVLAAQLYGTRPASETAAGAHMAAAYAAMLIDRWLSGDASVTALRVVIPVARGSVCEAPIFEQVSEHGECACGEELRHQPGLAEEPRGPARRAVASADAREP